MSNQDVPVLPSNLFPYIPFIPFRARRQSITLNPIQSLQQSFILSQDLRLELSLIPRLEFMLTQNVILSVEVVRAIANRLDQDIILQVYLSSMTFILEQDIEPTYLLGTVTTFTLDQSIEPTYLLSDTTEPIFLDLTLDQGIESSSAVGGLLDFTLTQDVIFSISALGQPIGEELSAIGEQGLIANIVIEGLTATALEVGKVTISIDGLTANV